MAMWNIGGLNPMLQVQAPSINSSGMLPSWRSASWTMRRETSALGDAEDPAWSLDLCGNRGHNPTNDDPPPARADKAAD
jgi:hypothetical protein